MAAPPPFVPPVYQWARFQQLLISGSHTSVRNCLGLKCLDHFYKEFPALNGFLCRNRKLFSCTWTDKISSVTMLRLRELRESLAAIQNKNGLWNICMDALLRNRKRFDIHALVWLSSKDFSLLIHCICCLPISGYCALWYLANSTVISETMQPGPLIPHFWVNSPGFNRVHWLFFPHMCCCNLPWMIFLKCILLYGSFLKSLLNLLQYCFCCFCSAFLTLRHVGS